MTMRTQTLALSSRQLEEFLTELLNLRLSDPAAVERFMSRFVDDFGLYEPDVLVRSQNRLQFFLENIQAAWLEPNAKVRLWGWAIFKTQWANTRFPDLSLSMHDEAGRKRFPPLPQELGIDMAFDYLLNHHNRTRYCPNPECPAPYFFAKRHSQRYCSEKCAQAAEKETKRKWWAEHGPAWRKKRRKVAGNRTPRKTARKLGKGSKS